MYIIHLLSSNLGTVGEFTYGAIEGQVHLLHRTLVTSTQLLQVPDTTTQLPHIHARQATRHSKYPPQWQW